MDKTNKKIKPFIEPGELPTSPFQIEIRSRKKSRRVTPFNRKRV
jgi:hypothetical protein